MLTVPSARYEDNVWKILNYNDSDSGEKSTLGNEL